MDLKSNELIKRLLVKLEKLYPEKKIFALSSLDDDLRESLNTTYRQLCYPNMDGLLHDLGYELISASAARDLRSFVLYLPGQEPEPIRSKIENALRMLDEYYPGKVVAGSIQNDHKSLYSKLSGLSLWLGYENMDALLEAYGYTRETAAAGRPENDSQALIGYLLEKYADKPKPKNMGMLIFDNPEYRGQLKTLQNKAPELFGMSLKAFLTDLGLFAEKEEVKPSAKTAGGSMQEAALDALRKLYADLDESVYGSFDQAAASLNGMTVKQNKAGQIYIFRVYTCPETLVLPYGVQAISSGVFKNQTALKELVLPDTMTEISSEAFSGCTALVSVRLPAALEEIGERAFAGCVSLQSMDFPSSVHTVGKEAFAGCSALADVKTNNPVMRVAPTAFDGCPYRYEPFSDQSSTDPSDFTWSPGKKDTAVITGYHGKARSIRVPAIIEGRVVSTIGIGAFQGNQELCSVTLPDTVTVLQKDSFRDCARLEAVHLSDNISKLITTTFSGCSSLREINIPDSMTELKRSCFRDCPIRVLHIGKSLQILPGDSFQYAHADQNGIWTTERTLEKVDVDPDNPWLRFRDGLLLSADGTVLYAALMDAVYYDIPESVEIIADNAFDSMPRLRDVRFPSRLKKIGAYAFQRAGLRSIRLPSSLRIVGPFAFYYCSDLSSILFEDGVEEICEGAFVGCPIVSVLLPATVKSLGPRSFPCFGEYDDKMLDFRIAEDNPYLRADGTALYQIENGEKTLTVLYGRRYKEIVWGVPAPRLRYEVEPDTKHIADEAFANCVNLTEVILPEGLTSIGRAAFQNTNAAHLVLPSTVKTVGGGAFAGERDFLGNRIGVGDVSLAPGNRFLFMENDGLYACREDGGNTLVAYLGHGSSVFTLCPGTVEIGAEAFAGSELCFVNLPVSIRAIGEHAFRGCLELRRLYLGFTDRTGQEKTAEIYLPAVEEENVFWGTSLRDQFMDCIRSGHEDGIFDFEKYDSLFESISAPEDKVLVAADRLKSGYRLAPTYAENYRRFLRLNSDAAAKVLIRENDETAVALLLSLECLDPSDADRYIALANQAGSSAVQVLLMNFKSTMVGFDLSDLDLDLTLDL